MINKKAQSLDKNVIIVLFVLAFFAVVVIIAYNQIYGKTQVAQEGLLSCQSFSGECMKDEKECYGEVLKNSTECTKNNEICCISSKSIIEALS